MWLKTISVERSRIMPGWHILRAETKVGDQVYAVTFPFDSTTDSFAQAVGAMMVYFGQAHGLVKIDADGDVVANIKRPDRIIPAKVLKNFTVLPSKQG
jgi:hypothetical protein